MSSNDDIRVMFFEECNDLMEALFEGLALLEDGNQEDDTVNAIFRSVHSIKGGAGAFKLEDLVSFAHKFETVLDELRAGRIESDPPLIQMMLRSADHLAHLIEASQTNAVINDVQAAGLLEELDGYIAANPTADNEVVFEPMALDFSAIGLEPAEDCIHIRFQPHAKLYYNGHDPLLLIETLRNKGTLSVEIDRDGLTTIDDFDLETPSLTFVMTFTAEDAEQIVEDVFEFVEGICTLEVSVDDAGHDLPDGTDTLIEAVPHPPEEMPQVAAEETLVAPKEPAAQRTETVAAQPTLRVELEKVDRLINTVGELIINQAMIAQRIEQLELPNDSELESDMTDYKMLARDLQEGVMSIRAQPVKTLFQRMARITREAGSATGKAVRFKAIGENTEVDKTVIERLADPLTHMIRNAVDHGLENSEQRIAAGKAETGEISLSASHKSGNVMIEITDDGAGLNRDRILQIAISKGLVPRDAELTDGEIDKLLFLPGFSTNDEVSELSGRGVGMDVVKRGVEALGGRISIASTPGKGTSFSIVLPLTLAVMDGIVISVAGETMIVPITTVIETLRPETTEIFSVGSDQTMLLIRGEYVPIVSIRKKLGLGCPSQQGDERVLVLVEGVDHTRCALLVDAIHDQRQVVIKSVGGHYGQIPGVSAATILGNGQIALILDTDHLSKVDVATSAHLPQNQEMRA